MLAWRWAKAVCNTPILATKKNQKITYSKARPHAQKSNILKPDPGHKKIKIRRTLFAFDPKASSDFGGRID